MPKRVVSDGAMSVEAHSTGQYPASQPVAPERASEEPDEALFKNAQATAMQRFRTYKLAVDSVNFGMTCEVAQTITFDDLSMRLRGVPLIKTMKLILYRVCVLTAEGVRTCPGSGETNTINVRVFLASFMIAYHPRSVFERVRQLETELIDASIKMLAVFDAICLAIIDTHGDSFNKKPDDEALTFPGVLHAYLKAFEAWKLLDEAKLTDRIKHALNALYHAEDHLIEGDQDTARLRTEFRSRQARLREKLVKIAGQVALDSLDALRVLQGDARARSWAKTEHDGVVGALGGLDGEGGYSALPRRMTNESLVRPTPTREPRNT